MANERPSENAEFYALAAGHLQAAIDALLDCDTRLSRSVIGVCTAQVERLDAARSADARGRDDAR